MMYCTVHRAPYHTLCAKCQTEPYAAPAPRTITITRTTRKTGEVMRADFTTERGALEYVTALLYDNTSSPKRLCVDVAEMLCNTAFTVRQTRYGPFLFTITRQ